MWPDNKSDSFTFHRNSVVTSSNNSERIHNCRKKLQDKFDKSEPASYSAVEDKNDRSVLSVLSFNDTRRVLKKGGEKLSKGISSFRTTIGTISQKFRISTKRRQILEEGPVTPNCLTPHTYSKTVLGRTPTKLYSPFAIETPQDKENQVPVTPASPVTPVSHTKTMTVWQRTINGYKLSCDKGAIICYEENMHIEDPDAFKTWLTAVLKPICEADPSALAKYVIALVKKDKSPEILRQSMVNQLEVFLQGETEQFVNQLFKTLETQDYITPVIPNTNPPNPNVVKTDAAAIKVPAKAVIPVCEIAANLTETLNGKGTIKEKEVVVVEVKKDVKKVENDKEEKPVRRRSRHRSSSRNRSRSRSWDRTRRSRSREKSRDRERTDREKRDRVRSWRNKSPPRRYERRRSVSPGGRVRSRSRSPRHNYRGGRYRNRSPPQRSNSRSRSRSLERRDRKDSRGDVKDRDTQQSGGATPTQDSNHAGDLDLRIPQSVPSSIVQPGVENRQVLLNSGNKRRCRDYDEKGFCMRGEMCPYDHGVDPVVLEDTALSRVLYAPNGGGDGILGPPPAVIPGTNNLMHMRPNIPPEYNPQAPQMWHHRPPGFRGGHRPGMNAPPPRVPSMNAFPQGPGGPLLPNIQQRELISVPVVDTGVPPPDTFNFAQGPPPNQPPGGFHHPDGLFKKKTFDYNRLGPRQKNPGNCSLELKKVPTGLNNITHLNNHFSKFGKIVNIQVYYENDPEGALVTFSSHAEANAAYRSTEAVLNNRFIKVFWHSSNPDGKQENVPPRSVKERLGQQPGNVPPNSNKVLNLLQPKAEKENTIEDPDNVDKAKEIELKKEDIKAQATLAIKKSQELLAAKEKLKKNQEEKRKEALKLTQDLRKRKQELLEKQLAQQKLLIEKMEKCPAGPQRDLLMQTIKKSQESIENIRKDLSQSVMTLKPMTPAVNNSFPAVARKSKEEAQKELLDAELDLISKQAEGADTSELQKKLFELKARAGIIPAPIRGRGRGTRRFHPISRHLLSKNNLIDQGMKGNIKSVNSLKPSFLSHAVDHRPTRLLVSGYESDEQDSVLTYFGQFGEIVDYVTDAATPSIVLNYKSRKEAEVAIVKGKHFQDRTLSVTWCNKAQLNNQLSGRTSSRTVLISESDEDHLMDSALLDGDEEMGPELSEEVLLQDDEEEEEESEDRSWRR